MVHTLQNVVCIDYPRPAHLSATFRNSPRPRKPLEVVIDGAGVVVFGGVREWEEGYIGTMLGKWVLLAALLREHAFETFLEWITWGCFVVDILSPPGEQNEQEFEGNELSGLWAILRNNEMLTWPEKVKFAIGLLLAMLCRQAFVEAQDGMIIKD
ncbi:hypothetical protein Ancab_029270 [Ancistrocladus abbreviatus]